MLTLNSYSLLLGSKSPRRAELLKFISEEFELVEIDVEETYPSTIHPSEIAEYLAVKKSKGFTELDSKNILITSDTTVVQNSEILGKPKSRDEAISMIAQLSDKTHEVITGVCLRSKEKIKAFSSSTMVNFVALTQAEIEHYVDNFKPYDKAGAYGIQEWIGAVGVSKINGSFYNVMGLPIHKLYHELKEFVQANED